MYQSIPYPEPKINMQIIYKDRKALPSQLPPQLRDLVNNPDGIINPSTAH
jgi:hypothetical protein